MSRSRSSAAVFVVAFGALQAMAGLLKAIAKGQATGLEGRQIWLRFATWILLGLEFALAADIFRTAVAPTWDDISRLAVIAFGLRPECRVAANRRIQLKKSTKNRPESGPLISWTQVRICGSVP